MERELTCISCPLGCKLSIDLETLNVKGNNCNRGQVYAISEITDPKRIVTTTIKIQSKIISVLPVKTEKPIPKDMTKDIVKAVNSTIIKAPIKVGDIVISNILDTGVNMVACRSIAE